MAEYQIGDIIIFSSMPSSQWVLAEIEEKTYKFINLWDIGKIWISQKKAPVHSAVMKHYRGDKELLE